MSITLRAILILDIKENVISYISTRIGHKVRHSIWREVNDLSMAQIGPVRWSIKEELKQHIKIRNDT